MELGTVSTQLTRQAVAPRDQQLWKACADFEALVLGSLLSLENGFEGLTGQASSSGQYAAMVMPRVAEELAEQSPLGLADLLYRQLEKTRFAENKVCEA